MDRRRYKDLDALKAMGGPFTFTTGAVDEYIAATDIDEGTKVGLSLPGGSHHFAYQSDLFRLMKDHRKLPINTSVVNVKLYLNNISLNVEVSVDANVEVSLDARLWMSF